MYIYIYIRLYVHIQHSFFKDLQDKLARNESTIGASEFKAQQVLNCTQFYLLYQSKISNFDAAGAAAANFTRFTSTKVQILTQMAQQHIDVDALRRKKAKKKERFTSFTSTKIGGFTCFTRFTSTKVQILTQKPRTGQ
jgi:hypothetical protein